MSRKVIIIGAGGMVGATVAHTLAVTEAVRDIVLIDVAEDLVHGQAMDVQHATGFSHGVDVRVGSYDDIDEDDIIVITCGLAQKPGQTRLELLEANARIMRDVTSRIKQQGEEVFILVVSNPVDVLTKVALETSGLPKHRVFGTGTTLDTSRLRVQLAGRLKVAPNSVQAYILGEHGDSSFAALSHASIAGIPLAKFPGFSSDMIETIEQDIRNAAYQIIESKKATYYGIGHSVANIVKALLRDSAQIYPVCSLTAGEYGLHDTVIGLPSMVSAAGIEILNGYPLDETELHKLHQSAEIINEAYLKA